MRIVARGVVLLTLGMICSTSEGAECVASLLRSTIGTARHVCGDVAFTETLAENEAVTDYSICVRIEFEGQSRVIYIKEQTLGDFVAVPLVTCGTIDWTYPIFLLRDGGRYIFDKEGTYRLTFSVKLFSFDRSIRTIASRPVEVTVLPTGIDEDYKGLAERNSTLTEAFQDYLLDGGEWIKKEKLGEDVIEYLLFQIGGPAVYSKLYGYDEQLTNTKRIDGFSEWAVSKCIDGTLICSLWQAIHERYSGGNLKATALRSRLRSPNY